MTCRYVGEGSNKKAAEQAAAQKALNGNTFSKVFTLI
jgi:dsRNA-specific ribonuclease